MAIERSVGEGKGRVGMRGEQPFQPVQLASLDCRDEERLHVGRFGRRDRRC
jgi:hypothetical protein